MRDQPGDLERGEMEKKGTMGQRAGRGKFSCAKNFAQIYVGCPARFESGDYPCIKTSSNSCAAFATTVPGPNTAAAPAVFKKS